jgi:hypothetical protein
MSKTNVTWVARVSGTSGDFGVYSDNQADQLFIQARRLDRSYHQGRVSVLH